MGGMPSIELEIRGDSVRAFFAVRIRVWLVAMLLAFIGTSINAEDWSGMSREQWQAVTVGEIQAIIAQEGISTEDEDGDPILLYAAEFASPEVILELIQLGADVNGAADTDGFTPLMAAAYSSNQNNVAVLVANGAQPLQESAEGLTALFYYLEHYIPTSEMLELLGASEHDPYLLNCYLRENVLSLIGWEEPLETIRSTLDLSVGLPLCDSRAPLIVANGKINREDQVEVGELLLARGEVIGTYDHQGNNTLHAAVRNGASLAYIEWALENGIDVNARNHKGETALHLLTKEDPHNTAAFSVLVEGGADAETLSDSGETPLGNLIEARNYDAIAMLLDGGLDPDSFTGNVKSYLEMVAELPNHRLVEMFLSHGADPNQSSRYNAPLLAAARHGTIETIEALLDAGATMQPPSLATSWFMPSAVRRNRRVSDFELWSLLYERPVTIGLFVSVRANDDQRRIANQLEESIKRELSNLPFAVVVENFREVDPSFRFSVGVDLLGAGLRASMTLSKDNSGGINGVSEFWGSTWATSSSDYDFVAEHFRQYLESRFSYLQDPLQSIQAPARNRHPDSFRVGDSGPGGGIIFYDKGERSDGWRYLEAAPEIVTWGNLRWVPSDGGGPTGYELGDGLQNTVQARNRISEGEVADYYDTVMYRVSELSFRGTDDWYLPSVAEAEELVKYLDSRSRESGSYLYERTLSLLTSSRHDNGSVLRVFRSLGTSGNQTVRRESRATHPLASTIPIRRF